MGQNCIAGTTEFDEENGIGLVMYVESGNNMIIWKMSDGTKQGTTVPVSSDYQNMLRSAFENKTGITIGYFIFHPYTEETIDIESSITINSGETPVENGFKWGIAGSPTAFIVGTYGSGEGEALTAYCYQHPSMANSFAVFNANGVLEQGGQGRNDQLEQMMISSMNEALGKQVEHIVMVSCPVAIGETLPQWENYESMNS